MYTIQNESAPTEVIKQWIAFGQHFFALFIHSHKRISNGRQTLAFALALQIIGILKAHTHSAAARNE